MRARNEMVALQEASTIKKTNYTEQRHLGILSERSAILICGLGVAVFTLPILVVLQVLSGLFWGGVTVYQLLNGSELDKIDEV